MQQDHRTWLGSILLVDIPLYEGLPQDRQNAVMRDLRHILIEHLKPYRSRDYEIYNDVSGYALCYLNKPENLLKIAMDLRDHFLQREQEKNQFYSVRFAINCPVRVVADTNGERRVEGHGVKHARRIIDYAGTNQLLISRSYYDILGCVSEDFHQMFHCIGRRGANNVHRNIIYEVVSWWDKGRQADETTNSAYQEVLESEQVYNDIETELESHRAHSAYPLALLRGLEHELANFVGPIAKFIVNAAVSKTANFEELCRTVAQDIPSPDQRAQFFESIRRLHH